MSYFLISRARKGTILSTDIIEALKGYGLPVFESRTTHREVYAKTASEGLTVHSDLQSVAAINEIKNLKEEVLKVLKV
jgi:chromosome partitioning protein